MRGGLPESQRKRSFTVVRSQLVHAKLEDALETGALGLAAGEVDVIVSEWMGYALLYEVIRSSAARLSF